MDDPLAGARALEAVRSHVAALEHIVEGLQCSVAALIRLLPPDRFAEYERQYAEIYGRASGDAAVAETLSRMRQKPEDDDDPSRSRE